RVSNDNPMSESLFKTLKYNALLPLKPFDNIQEAREWVYQFVQWYNHEHLHSSNQFITPADKRVGKDVAKLQKRQEVMNRKKESHPNRWAKGRIRDWSPITKVTLNEMPKKEKTNGVA
ncbi:integrase core domain-containing protein, partial [Thorsellia kenyensis]